jgi:DNA-binding transcriptional LysR family regulator
MDFDSTLLRAFVAVKETGGFTRAAQRLHLTQSAVSHQIRKLEEQIGRSLFFRTTRSLTLTEDGENFLTHAVQILESLDTLARRFQPSAVSGIVRFGVPETFLGEQLPETLGQFTRAYPAVRLDVNVGTYLDLRGMIAAGELDLAVVLSERRTKSEGVLLRRTKFVWVATETFDLPPETSLPLAFAPAPCVDRRVGIDALKKTDVKWHVGFTSPSQEGIRTAILAGIAVGIQMQSDVKPGMRIIDGKYGLPPLPKAEFTLISKRGESSAAVKEFARLLQSAQPLRSTSGAAMRRKAAALPQA